MTAFWILAPVMVLAALGLVFARKAVHGALCLAVVMLSLAVLYAAQGAPFLFAVQVIVYTGAIMMLFLFVLMLVGVESRDTMLKETIRGQRAVGFVIVVLFGLLFLGLMFLKDSVPDIRSNPEVLEFIKDFTGYGIGSVLIFFVFGTILTIVVQSSSVAGAITLTMAFKGWIDYPTAAREAEIINRKVPELEDGLALSLAEAMRRLREMELFKPPGVAETLDWAESLRLLQAGRLTPSTIERTIGVVLKYKDDIDMVRSAGVETLVG